METPANLDHVADVSAAEHAARELVGRIRKLRWMGMNEEAERLQLALRDAPPTDTLLAGPCDTD